MTESIVEAIRRYAGAHMDVATSIACEGTSLEATTFNLAGKAFMFLRTVPGGQEVRLKLGASREQIEKLGEQWPDSYSIGSSGWAKVIVSEERSLDLVKKWIAESYALISSGRDGTSGASRVAFASPTKPPAAPAPKPKRAASTKPAAKPGAISRLAAIAAATRPAVQQPAVPPAKAKPEAKKPAAAAQKSAATKPPAPAAKATKPPAPAAKATKPPAPAAKAAKSSAPAAKAKKPEATKPPAPAAKAKKPPAPAAKAKKR